MKRGQLLSQPFFYIFAIIVIGLIFAFGFYYVNKVVKAGCEAEVLDFTSEFRKQVSEVASLGFGSSFECSVVRAAGQSESVCELILPQGVAGVCFADTTKGIVLNSNIKFDDVGRRIRGLGENAKKNAFFSKEKNSDCKANDFLVKKLTTEEVVCVDYKDSNNFVIENKGRE